MAKRTYSDEEKAATLLTLEANGGNVSETSRKTGVPRPTIRLWRGERKDGQKPWVADICHARRIPLADRLEALAHSLIDAIPGKVSEATLGHVAQTLNVALDKMRLLREQATSIARTDHLSDTERADRIVAALARAGEGAGDGVAFLFTRGEEAEGTRSAPPAVH